MDPTSNTTRYVARSVQAQIITMQAHHTTWNSTRCKSIIIVLSIPSKNSWSLLSAYVTLNASFQYQDQICSQICKSTKQKLNYGYRDTATFICNGGNQDVSIGCSRHRPVPWETHMPHAKTTTLLSLQHLPWQRWNNLSCFRIKTPTQTSHPIKVS